MLHDFISLADFETSEVVHLLELAGTLKKRLKERREERPLQGQTLAMIFEKPSLRTRVTFEVGIAQLGGHGILLESGQIKLGERESVPDVARNLERWVDGIMARTFSHAAVVELAQYASVPVINALTDELHPCQIMADALTLQEHRGDIAGLTLAFVGDGNNVCASWFELAAHLPINVTLVCPKGYEGDQRFFEHARQSGKGQVRITNDIEEGVRGADAIYTDVWASMGQEDEAAERRKVFAPYQVNAKLMALANKDALFMHCLPAHRGEECTNDVIEGPQSIVFDEAENRLHAQKAVMLALMEKGPDGLCAKQRARKAR